MQSRNWTTRSSIAKLASIGLTASAAGALLVVAAVTLVFSSPASADHNSMYAVCPDPIPEGNSSQMGVRRSGYKIKSAYFFTDHAYYTADSDDYEEYHGVKIESESSGGDTTLWAPIVTKEDALPEHDETFVMGFWDGGRWHGCLITIEDDDAPEVIGVSISSSPVDRYAYRARESIDVAVDLDQKVDVGESSMLSLFIGDGDGSTWRGADYHSGSGTRSLVYRYNVRAGDFDSDGLSVGSASVGDDRTPATGFIGNIYAAGTDVPINYAHSGHQGDWRQKVDGRPYVQSSRISSSPPDGWDAYRANQVIEVTMNFNMDVVVEGDVSIELHLGLDNYNWDVAKRLAQYIRGSGTDVLVFGYTVQSGDMDPEGVGLVMGTERYGFVGDGAIKAKGTNVERNPWYIGTGHQPDHKVDTAPPSVSSVSIASQPNNGKAYVIGELIGVEVVFSEGVTIRGDVRLEMDIGGVPGRAAYTGDQGFVRTALFQYEVEEGDVDTDGIGIGANRILLDGGGIYDRAGNAAGLSHPAVAVDPAHKVDGSR